MITVYEVVLNVIGFCLRYWVWWRCRQDYLTPLHVAAHCGNVKTAKLLLDRKC